jgi:hypothetical protein
MRFRDIVVAALGVAALVGLWSQEGSISLDLAFYSKMQSVGYHRYLPAPIVGDITGDGTNDVLVAVQTDKIALLRPLTNSRTPVSLEGKVTATFFSNLIGLSTGYITFPQNHSSVSASESGLWFGGNTGKRHAMQGHSRHVAVVTDDYRLTLLNSKLQEVWSASVVEAEDVAIVPKQATVVVLPDKIYEGDSGLVVVAVPLLKDGAFQHSIAAFNGADGALRWRRILKSSVDEGANLTVEAMTFKFSEKDLTAHANNRPWTAFREAVVANMPHGFAHPWHARMSPFRFVHSKNAKKTQRDQQSTVRPKEYHELRQSERDDEQGKLGQRYASAVHGGNDFKGGGRRQHLRPLPNAVALHLPQGVHFIHLFTGRAITSFAPTKTHRVYDDVDDDLVIDVVSNNIGATQETFSRHGIAEGLRCVGEVSSNALETGHLMSSASICDTEGYMSALGLLRHVVRGDAADHAAPTIDPLERLGSRSVVDSTTEAAMPTVLHLRRPMGRHIYKSERYAMFFVSHGIVTAVNAQTNAVVWRADTPSTFKYSSSEDAATASFAAETEEERLTRLHLFPHTVAYTFHNYFADASDVRNVKSSRHRHEPMLAVVGSHHLTLLNSLHGNIEASTSLDHMPIAPTIVGDIDGDEVNDLIVTTAAGYYGFVVRRHSSGSASASVMLVGLAVVGILFVSQHGERFDRILGNTGGQEEVSEPEVSEDEGPVLGMNAGLRRRSTKRSTD